MILLQTINKAVNITSTNTSEPSVWFIIEILLIIAVIIYQLYHSRNVYLNIEELKRIFNHRIDVKSGYIEKVNLNKKEKTIEDIVFIDGDDKTNTNDLFSDQKIVKISIAETSGNGIICNIKDDINNYLLNNYGAAVNFSIIKDIIDRAVDIKDEEISHSIPTPLYLGLAATMIGIIFGLFSMPDLGGVEFSKGIEALITGVKLAMFGSLTGLACTTILSSIFYKNAKAELLKGKNKQISDLVAKLLPELEKTGELGISGLRNSLDKFSINTTGFAKVLHETTLKTESNLKIQQEIIQKIDRMDVLKVSKANIELFDRLDHNMDAFNKFSESLSIMSLISSNLKEFASRTTNIDKIVDQIDFSLQENVRLQKFLSEHFEQIDTLGKDVAIAIGMSDQTFGKAIDLLDSNLRESLDKLKTEIEKSEKIVSSAVINADSHTREVIEKLESEIKNRISLLNQTQSDFESNLAEIYSDIKKQFEEIGSKHIQEFQSVYSNAIPKFDQLVNLEVLPEIKDQVIESANKFQNHSHISNSKLIESIDQINNSLKQLIESVNNKAILNKLDVIEKNLKRKTYSGNGSGVSTQKVKTSFLQKLRNRFKRKDKVKTYEEK